ncbi:hypothetical protein BCV70DRAFT_156991 [Testicularia cyperi]|uniref:Rhodanese domain-containing protein n=1 Tax=Testicularia cyperi TaxID=1882483 RepID=A0A317XVU3_9BASI|nr:hypothetical protein BCV70DRAFT_156991 [Testicularia cyperi]
MRSLILPGFLAWYLGLCIIRQAWTELFYDSADASREALRSQALAGKIPKHFDGDLRWICWKLFLFHDLSSTLSSWTAFLNKERDTYTELRSKLLRAPDGNYPPEVGLDIRESDPSSGRFRGAGAATGYHHNTDGNLVHDLSINNPLSLDESNPWKTYYAALDIRRVISQDVERTFPDLELFRDTRVQQGLTNALFVWSIQNEDVGYRQGMHELLAVLWMVRAQSAVPIEAAGSSLHPSQGASPSSMDEVLCHVLGQRWIEHDVYTLFCALMKHAKSWFEWRDREASTKPSSSVSPPSPTTARMVTPIVAKCEHIQTLLHRLDPALAQHLDALGIEPQIFALRWVRLIFTRECPLDDALVLWDGLFAADASLRLIDYICLAMLVRVRSQILEADYSSALQIVLRYPATSPFRAELLVNQALSIRQEGPSPTAGVTIALQNRDLLGIEPQPAGSSQDTTSSALSSPSTSMSSSTSGSGYVPRMPRFATVGRSPGAYTAQRVTPDWAASISSAQRSPTATFQNGPDRRAAANTDPLGVSNSRPMTNSLSGSRAFGGINPSSYLSEGISDFAKGLYERAEIPQTLNTAIANVSKTVAAAALSVAASSGPGGNGQSGFPSRFGESLTASNPGAARGSPFAATVGHAASGRQRLARQPLPSSLNNNGDGTTSRDAANTSHPESSSAPRSASTPEIIAKLEGLTTTNKAVGAALSACIEVLETRWMSRLTSENEDPGTADADGDVQDADVDALMAFTALKHIRDVLNGTALEFDPATLPRPAVSDANSSPKANSSLPSSRSASTNKESTATRTSSAIQSTVTEATTAEASPADADNKTPTGRAAATHPSHLPMSLPEYARYGRQMILPDFGLPAQLRLRDARVLVVGAGGLGCPAIQYLAAAGVGRISILDHDIVEPSNLARQILHTDAKVGMAKAESAAQAARHINPYIHVTPICSALSASNARELVRGHDLVLDCTDNPLTRYLVSDAAVLEGVQVVSGAAQGYDGQLVVLHKKILPAFAGPKAANSDVADVRGPCYRCLFPKAPKPEEVTNCEDGGVLGGVTGLVGTMQALESVKILANIGEQTPPLLTLLAPMTSTPFRSIKLRSRRLATCRACGDPQQVPETMITDLEREDYVSFCGLVRSAEQSSSSGAASTRTPAGSFDSSATVVDVRPAIEFGITKLDGSINIPIQQLLKDPASAYREILETSTPDSKPVSSVLLVCKKGNDSQLAVSALAKEQEMLLQQGRQQLEAEQRRLEDEEQQRQASALPRPIAITDMVGGLRAYSRVKDSTFPIY